MLSGIPYIFGGALVAGAYAIYHEFEGWNSDVYMPILLVVGGISSVVFGAAATLVIYVKFSPPHKANIQSPKEVLALHNLILSIDWSSYDTLKNKHDAIISRKVDAAVNEVLECFCQNQVIPWYSTIVGDTSSGVNHLKDVLWFVVSSFHQRLSRMDHVKFFMCCLLSCLTQHLEKIRIAEATGEARGERGIFLLSSQLSSPIRERNFLRLVSDFLITKTFPPEYSRSSAVKSLLKELIACKVFEPLIDRISDPFWINQQLLLCLRQQQAAEELGKRTYHYAASYEEFINLIQDSSDVADLKHLRRNIINEIMQAAAINNLKKAKGIDLSRETTPQSTGKGDLLQARNLKRYINQLTYAKAQCERRINMLRARSKSTSSTASPVDSHSLGDAEETVPDKSIDKSFETDEKPVSDSFFTPSNSLQMLPGRKVLMFQVLLESAFARRFFSIYLDEIGQGALLSFWTAVQELKHSDKKHHYQLGMEIYHTYLASQVPPIKVEKMLLRGVETFLLGDRSPDVLYEIMDEVERTLEDRHYAGFLVSSTYHAMLLQAQAQSIDFMTELEDELTGTKSGDMGPDPEVGVEISLQLSDHSTYARNKLALLQERLTNKLLALQAIKQTKKADPKVIIHLEGEIDSIRNEHKQLEGHVERTALWSDHLGLWKVLVHQVQLSQDKDAPRLVLLVHLESELDTVRSEEFIALLNQLVAKGEPFTDPALPINGWMVIQKISNLVEMHRKLLHIAPWIKSLELPSANTKLLFNKQLDKPHLERVLSTSQKYFNVVMNDESLQVSELIYAFLSPSPEHLKQMIAPIKKSRFWLSTLFKSDGKSADCEDDLLGNLIIMDNTSSESSELSEHSSKNSIVEPLFAFLEEVCELRGLGKWLRKTMISFVQITYGKNITKHVREIVQGQLTESMIVYYLQMIRSSFWPDKDMSNPQPESTKVDPEDVVRVRNEAHELIVRNLPELLCTLVGQQNARNGATRLFSVLQNHALNKELIYTALEVTLLELFPELNPSHKK